MFVVWNDMFRYVVKEFGCLIKYLYDIFLFIDYRFYNFSCNLNICIYIMKENILG